MRYRNYIKEMREARGLSQEALAEMLNTSNPQISHLELGKRRLTWEWMMRIATALECHPTDLVEGPALPSSPEEKELLSSYRQLDATEREVVKKMTNHFADSKRQSFAGKKN